MITVTSPCATAVNQFNTSNIIDISCNYFSLGTFGPNIFDFNYEGFFVSESGTKTQDPGAVVIGFCCTEIS